MSSLQPGTLIVRKGKAAGVSHIEEGMPCQDHVDIDQFDDYVLLLVSDGSSGAGIDGDIFTHIGSIQLILWTKEVVRTHFASLRLDDRETIEEVQIAVDWLCGFLFERLIHNLRVVAATFSPDPAVQADWIGRMYHATLRCILITKKWTIRFKLGDGIEVIGETVYEDDEQGIPRYLAYAALLFGFAPNPIRLPTRMWDPVPEKFEITIVSNEGITTWLEASDGAKPFLHNSDMGLPAPDIFGEYLDTVGPITQFFSEHVRTNDLAIDLRLAVLTRNNPSLIATSGARKEIFIDDIAIVCAMRPHEEQEISENTPEEASGQ